MRGKRQSPPVPQLGVILRDPPKDSGKWLLPAWSSLRDVLRKITESLQAAKDATNGEPGDHMLLGGSHDDTVRSIAQRGDLISAQLTGVDGAKWRRLALGGAELLLYSNGTDVVWSQATTGSYTDRSVTFAKLPSVTASRLLGRGSAAGAGDVQEILLGSGLSMSGTTLSATASGILTTKGDLFTHDGTNPVRLPVGANGAHLVADSSTTTGLRWGAIPLRPAQVTANQNNYAPGSFGTWFINTDASRNFTGISATGADDGLEFLWINNGSFDEVLQHENAGSTAANRLICAGGGDLTVLPNEMVRIIRDGTAARFRCFLF